QILGHAKEGTSDWFSEFDKALYTVQQMVTAGQIDTLAGQALFGDLRGLQAFPQRSESDRELNIRRMAMPTLETVESYTRHPTDQAAQELARTRDRRDNWTKFLKIRE